MWCDLKMDPSHAADSISTASYTYVCVGIYLIMAIKPIFDARHLLGFDTRWPKARAKKSENISVSKRFLDSTGLLV